MGYFMLGCAPLTFLLLVSAGANAVSDVEEKRMIERIDKRYDDFFHRQQQEEKLDRERRAGIPELEKRRKARDHALNRAREEYTLHHKATVLDPKLEAKWEEQQKDRREEQKLNARRFLEREIKVEKIESRGRKIPGNLEFDIEDLTP